MPDPVYPGDRQDVARERGDDAQDQARAFAVIGEAVWWITIVDGTLVRHHPEAYDRVLAGQTAAERRRTEGTLAGLRFVRNRMGHGTDHADFIHSQASRPGRGDDRVMAWSWKSVPEPAVAALPPRGQVWEMMRYRAYQAHLASRTTGEIFGRGAVFLELTAAQATSVTCVSADAAR